MQKSQSPFFELGESNIFEEFYELIEKHRLNTSKDFNIEDMYIKLSSFDSAYQKFSSSNNQHSNRIVYSYLNHCLYCFLMPFRFNGFSDRPFYWAFIRFIQFSTILLEYSSKINNPHFYYRNISQNFPSFWKGPYIDILKENKFNFNLYSVEQFDEYYPAFRGAERNISNDFGTNQKVNKKFKLYITNFEVLELTYKLETDSFEIGNKTYEMELDFHLKNNNNDAQKLLESLYFIITALSNIKNVKLEIEELQVGSLIGKVRLYINDLIAKEETKAVLETAKESVIKTITGGVSHSETKKTIQETHKTKKETELLDKELRDKPTDIEAQLSNALNLEKQALENEQLRIQNAKEKLEIIDKLSDLAAKGILEADSVKIDINGILYLLKSDEGLKVASSDINEIT